MHAHADERKSRTLFHAISVACPEHGFVRRLTASEAALDHPTVQCYQINPDVMVSGWRLATPWARPDSFE